MAQNSCKYELYENIINGGSQVFNQIVICNCIPKSQIISECPYEIIVSPRIATKKFPRFLPWPLSTGPTKNFIKPIMLNNP